MLNPGQIEPGRMEVTMVTKEELEKADKALDRISEIVGVAMCDCLANKDDGEAVHFLRNLIRQIEAEM